MKLLIFVLLGIGMTLTSSAQELRIKSCTLVANDLSASVNEVKDLNGEACVLVKIPFPVPCVHFIGDGLIETQYKNSEYWVYISSRLTEFTMKVNGYDDMQVRLLDYGSGEFKAKQTYSLQLDIPNSFVDVFCNKSTVEELLDIASNECMTEEQSFVLYLKTAMRGNSEGQYKTGICYECGIGISRNIDKAIFWYKKAFAQGSVDAALSLAMIFIDNEKMDFPMGIKLLEYCAEKGNHDAEVILGEFYLLGIGVNAESKKACKLYENAAKGGSVEGAVSLGEYLEFERQDVKTAISWYKKAAAANNEDAIEHLKRLGQWKE